MKKELETPWKILQEFLEKFLESQRKKFGLISERNFWDFWSITGTVFWRILDNEINESIPWWLLENLINKYFAHSLEKFLEICQEFLEIFWRDSRTKLTEAIFEVVCGGITEVNFLNNSRSNEHFWSFLKKIMKKFLEEILAKAFKILRIPKNFSASSSL